MVTPNLINPTPAFVRLKSEATTRFSNTARQTKGKTVYAAEVEIPCQPFIGKVDDPETQPGGSIKEEVEGYIVVRGADMNSLLTRKLDRGDKVVGLGTGTNRRDIEYYIVGSKTGAAYDDQDGFSLRKYFFAARIENQRKNL